MSAGTFTSCPSLRKSGWTPCCSWQWTWYTFLVQARKCLFLAAISLGSTRESSIPVGCTSSLIRCNLDCMAWSESWMTFSKAQKAWKSSPSKFLPWSVWIITGTPYLTTYCLKKACATDFASRVTSFKISNQHVKWLVAIRAYLLLDALTEWPKQVQMD